MRNLSFKKNNWNYIFFLFKQGHYLLYLYLSTNQNAPHANLIDSRSCRIMSVQLQATTAVVSLFSAPSIVSLIISATPEFSLKIVYCSLNVPGDLAMFFSGCLTKKILKKV